MELKTQKKLNHLQETKSLIKAALIEKGQSVSDTDTFRSYADKIRAISGGGSNVEPEITVLLEPMLIGPFSTDGNRVHPTTNEALYAFSTEQAPVRIEKGKTYIVDWDGVQYTVVCKETSVDGLQSEILYLGDGVMLSGLGIGVSGESSSEPFAIMQATLEVTAVYFVTTDEGVTHTFGLSLVEMPSVAVEPLTVTENGTYTAPEGTAYSPVTVNIAGSGGETNWVSASGVVQGTGSSLVITHGLGVIPDIIYFAVGPQPTAGEAMLVYQLGYSKAMVDGFGEGFEKECGRLVYCMGNGSVGYGNVNLPVEELTSSNAILGGLCNVNETTFMIKYYSALPISSAKKVTWYAIGGIT